VAATNHRPHRSRREIVEEVRSAILDDLRPFLSSLSLPKLPDLAEQVEEMARQRLLASIRDFAPQICLSRKAATEGCLVHSDGTVLHYSAADDLEDRQRLGIVFTPVSETKPRMRQRQIAIAGPGRYAKVRYFWPHELALDFELLTEITRAALETAYSWFKTAVHLTIDHERLSLGQHLYRSLRTVIPDDSLRENLWFATVTDDYGFRLLDPDLAHAAFGLIQPHAPKYGYSVNRLVAELLSTRLPRAKLLMQRAVAENRCVVADLSTAIYRKEGSIYASALAALYGSESFAVSPILTKGPICIVALYPATQQAAIEPLLVRHRSDLEAEAKKSLSLVHRTLKAFEKRPGFPLGKAGEFVGGALKGFLDQ
jgi:hypothetical protein